MMIFLEQYWLVLVKSHQCLQFSERVTPGAIQRFSARETYAPASANTNCSEIPGKFADFAGVLGVQSL